MYALNEERPGDLQEIEELYDLCFAPGRGALSSYRLREGREPVAGLCVAARDGTGALVAAVRHWSVAVDSHPALLLGPLAVHPTRQGEGLGASVIADSLAKARARGWQRVLLVGDQPYFGRLGFVRLNGVEMPPPTNPDRILGLALTPGAWDGISGKVTAAC
ncbi:MAG: N-acetyltransferase [Rhodobacter sp.]|nr:N-acetyltransferase [Rhodobacter sp.]MCY4167048.1 N-acetyltransferase [Rhodobacter sp.]MCY4242648.1 N-acetyltransferase [Rhodobacter sp.]